MLDDAVMASFWQEVAAIEEIEKTARLWPRFLDDAFPVAHTSRKEKKWEDHFKGSPYHDAAKQLAVEDGKRDAQRARREIARERIRLRQFELEANLLEWKQGKEKGAAFGGLRALGRRAGAAVRGAAARPGVRRALTGAGIAGGLGGSALAGYAGTRSFLGRSKKKKKGMKVGRVPMSAKNNPLYKRLLVKVKQRFPEIPGSTIPWLVYLAMKERGLLK